MNKKLIFAVILIGFSSILTQILVLREAISGFYANELVLGVILGNWLLLTGVGSYLGRYSSRIKLKIRSLVLSFLGISVVAPWSVFLIKIIRNFVVERGELVSLQNAFFYSFIILSPFCLLSGFQFVLGCSIFSKKGEEKGVEASRVYFLDGLGDMLAGTIFSFVFVFVFNSFQSISFVIFLNLFCAFLLSKRKLRLIVILLSIFFVVFLSIFNLQGVSSGLLFSGQDVVYDWNSLYGNLIVTEKDKQLNFYENGFLLFSTGNKFENEEKVHYNLLQNKGKRVLLISGGVGGSLNEILKYDTNVDYVELDKKIVEIGKRFNKIGESVNVFNVDGRLFVKNSKNKYDNVIIDLPDPNSIQINRFYTLEFFKEVKKILNEEGVVSLSLKAGENYLSEESRKLNSVTYKTLKEVFGNVIIIPGGVNYFIASDKELSYDYKRLLKEKNIEADYIEFYSENKLSEDRIEEIKDVVKKENTINKDFKPVSHYLYLSYWLSLFKINYWVLLVLVLLVLVIVLFLIRMKEVPFALFITGFSGSSLELIIIIGFQILYGYVYSKIGLIIAMFMFGLLIGALVGRKMIKKEISKKSLAKFDFLICVYSLLLPAILSLKIPEIIDVEVLFPLMTIIIGFLVGVEFPIGVRILERKEIEKSVGLLSAVDLVGACLGAYVVSVFLIPKLGIFNVSFFIAGLNFLSGGYLLLRAYSQIP